MPFLILTALILSIPNSSFLLKNASSFSKRVHNNCLDLLPSSSQNFQAHAALLCGENVTVEKLKSSLIKSSLIHLFVVSGSHLILLEEFFLFFRLPFFLRFLFYALYALACSWQAPVVRAWLSLGSREFFSRLALRWPADLLVLFTGLSVLLLFPEWVSSRSLIMSWLAALALSISSFLPLKNPLAKIFLQSTLIYLLMIPALWGFGNLHPLSIVFNIFLAPLVSLILLPLSFLNCFLSFLTPVFDQAFLIFLWLSEKCTEPIVLEQRKALDISSLWFFIFLLHFLLHILRIFFRRERT